MCESDLTDLAFAFHHSPFTIYRLPFAICHPPFTICICPSCGYATMRIRTRTGPLAYESVWVYAHYGHKYSGIGERKVTAICDNGVWQPRQECALVWVCQCVCVCVCGCLVLRKEKCCCCRANGRPTRTLLIQSPFRDVPFRGNVLWRIVLECVSVCVRRDGHQMWWFYEVEKNECAISFYDKKYAFPLSYIFHSDYHHCNLTIK